MTRTSFAGIGAIAVSDPDALVGLTDLSIAETSNGPVLFAVARGGGALTGFSLGAAPGGTLEADSWAIPGGYLQLESTDLAVLSSGSGGARVLMAGLDSTALIGFQLTGAPQGALLGGSLAYSTAGLDMGDIREIEVMPDGQTALAAVRGDGLVLLDFAGGSVTRTVVASAAGLDNAAVSALASGRLGGTDYAVVGYGSADTVVLYRLTGGAMQPVASLDNVDGAPFDRPGALTMVTGTDGGLYAIMAASGTGSLTVFQVTATGLFAVDHLLDTRDSRFADATHVEALDIGGQPYVLAAGSDAGLSLLAVLPGGRLHLVATIEGSAALPLNGITAVEVLVDGAAARIWVATEAAPHLSEFHFSLDAPGQSLTAAAGGSTLDGGGGDDILGGQGGDDILQGGAGDDILLDGAGADDLRGGAGADAFILVADGEIDRILDFQFGQDRIDLSSLASTGTGAANLVVISRGWGAELQIGGEVIEVYSAGGEALNASHFGEETLIGLDRPLLAKVEPDPATPPPPPAPPPPTPEPPPPDPAPVTRLPGPPPVGPIWQAAPSPVPPSGGTQGTAAPDNVSMGAAANAFLGMAGNDSLYGGGGNDTIAGHGGNDRIQLGSGNDLGLGGLGFDTLEGGSGNDTLHGEDHADLLHGDGGRDVLTGGSGYDLLYGGDGNDSIWAGSEPDRVWGGNGHDWISGGSNFSITVDGIWGEGGNDTIFGHSGYDFLDGGEGDDVIDGGHQADNLFGRDGNDTLLGDFGLDRLFGGNGDDMLYGGDGNDGHFGEHGNDTMWGGAGQDRFFGGPGNDIVDGGSGHDTIQAGSGFDTVIGGSGNDILQGDFNADVFYFSDGHGQDTIRDFDALNDLERIDFSAHSTMNTLQDVMGAAVQLGGHVRIDTGGGDSVLLQGVWLPDLDAGDFIF